MSSGSQVSGSTYSVPLLTTTSQVSGSQISIAPSSAYSLIPPTVSTPASSLVVPTVSTPASSLIVPTVSTPASSLLAPTVSTSVIPPFSVVSASTPAGSLVLGATGAVDLGATGAVDLSSTGPTAPIAVGLPGPSGQDVDENTDPEEVILRTYRLLREIGVKLDILMRNDASTQSGLTGVGNTVQGTSSTLSDVQQQLGNLTSSLLGEGASGPALQNPGTTEEEEEEEDDEEDDEEEEEEENNTGENNTEENNTEENSNLEGGARRNRSRKAQKKKRRTHKRRKV